MIISVFIYWNDPLFFTYKQKGITILHSIPYMNLICSRRKSDSRRTSSVEKKEQKDVIMIILKVEINVTVITKKY